MKAREKTQEKQVPDKDAVFSGASKDVFAGFDFTLTGESAVQSLLGDMKGQHLDAFEQLRATVRAVEEALQYRRQVLITLEEDNIYSVIVPSLPGCYSQGDTLEEAIANAREAIQGHVATLKKLGKEVPEERNTVHLVTL